MLGKYDLLILSELTKWNHSKDMIYSKFPERSYGTQARLDLLLEEKLIKINEEKDTIEITSLGFKYIQDHNEKFKIERSIWYQKLIIEILLTTIIATISSIIVAYITVKYIK